MDIRTFFKRKRSDVEDDDTPSPKKSINCASNLELQTESDFTKNVSKGALVDKTNVFNAAKSKFMEVPTFSSDSEDETEAKRPKKTMKTSTKEIDKNCSRKNINDGNSRKNISSEDDQNSDKEVSFNVSKKPGDDVFDKLIANTSPKKLKDMGPLEFSDESSDEEVDKGDTETKESSKNDEPDEEFEVEAILDYQWCKVTVRISYKSYLCTSFRNSKLEGDVIVMRRIFLKVFFCCCCCKILFCKKSLDCASTLRD